MVFNFNEGITNGYEGKKKLTSYKILQIQILRNRNFKPRFFNKKKSGQGNVGLIPNKKKDTKAFKKVDERVAYMVFSEVSYLHF